MKISTDLFRNMPTAQDGRTAFMCVLSSAHATPHRLFRQNIVPTPCCKYCSCADADVLHIAFECPGLNSFAKIGLQFWKAILAGPFVPKPALLQLKHYRRKSRHNGRKFSSVLLSFLRLGCRFPEHVIQITPESHAVDCLIDPQVLTGVACLTQHPSPVPAENKLDTKWEPPANVSAVHRWGADRKDYNAIFILEKLDYS